MNRMIKKAGLLPAFLICIASSISAQEKTYPYENPEAGFTLMREFASEGRYDTAKKIGYELLGAHPGYHDVAIYLSRIHGWEGEYDSAHVLLELSLIHI